MRSPTATLDMAALRRGFAGQVLLPGETAFDRARRVWNAMVNRRPAVIARCASRTDFAAAVRFGRSRGLDVGVRGGGHSVLGLAVPDGGLKIDLSPIAAVRVDPDRRRARVQGGALLGALDRAAQSSGLATTAGNLSHTGVGGLTLVGGRAGWPGSSTSPATTSCASSSSPPPARSSTPASRRTRISTGARAAGEGTGPVRAGGFESHPPAPSTRWIRNASIAAKWFACCTTGSARLAARWVFGDANSRVAVEDRSATRGARQPGVKRAPLKVE